MQNKDQEITELVRILIESTCAYAAPRIQNEGNRFAYVRAMSRCFAICDSEESGNDFNKMKLDLLKVLHDCGKENRRSRFFSNSTKYYKMGVEHVLDIVESISRRFSTGYTYATDKSFTRTILEVFYREG